MKLLAILLMLMVTNISSAQNEKGTREKWQLDKNKYLTGGLVFVAGSAKGFCRRRSLVQNTAEFILFKALDN